VLSSGYIKLGNKAAESAAACTVGCKWLVAAFQEGFSTSKLLCPSLWAVREGCLECQGLSGPCCPSSLSINCLVGRHAEGVALFHIKKKKYLHLLLTSVWIKKLKALLFESKTGTALRKVI